MNLPGSTKGLKLDILLNRQFFVLKKFISVQDIHTSIRGVTLKSLISMEFFLFFLRKISQLHALLEPPRLFIFGEKSHLHDY